MRPLVKHSAVVDVVALRRSDDSMRLALFPVSLLALAVLVAIALPIAATAAVLARLDHYPRSANNSVLTHCNTSKEPSENQQQ